jgi:hypothetical protein
MIRALCVLFLFFVGLTFLFQSYSLAFHGIYFDCLFRAAYSATACPPVSFGRPGVVAYLMAMGYLAAAGLTFFLAKQFVFPSSKGVSTDEPTNATAQPIHKHGRKREAAQRRSP